MSIPVMILLGYAAWTLLILVGSIGVYRWSCIVTGRASMAEWRADLQRLVPACYARAYELRREPPDLYGNCGGTHGHRPTRLDHLAIAILPARIGQTLTHIVLPPTNAVTSLRFGFFCIQLACMISIGAIITADILPRA
jgi:hypothetical protein